MGKEARRISSQHRQLDTFYELIERALDEGRAADARAGAQRFGDALEAHFSLEDHFYFPALHGLRPELDGELGGLVDEHQSLLAEFRAAGALLEASRLPAAREALEAFVAQLTDHEEREEALLARLEGGGRAT